MGLYLSYVAGLRRDNGQTDFLAFAASVAGGGACAVVAHVHETLRGASPEGEALREKYSDAIFVVDNQVRAQYAFPAAAEQKRQRLLAQLGEAHSKAESAARIANDAKAAAATAKAATDQQKAASNRVKELEAELAKLNVPAPESKEPEKEVEPAK